MGRRIALAFLAVLSPLMVAGLLAPGRLGIWLFALGAGGFPVALSALGAARRGRLGRLAWSLALLLVLIEGGVVAVLVLSGGGPGGPGGPGGLGGLGGLGGITWGGWPLALLAPLLGFWLLAFPLVTFAYALTFEVAEPPPAAPTPGAGEV